MPHSRATLKELEPHQEFIRRHIGPDTNDITQMLAELGIDSLDDLLYKAVPDVILSSHVLDIPEGISEAATIAEMRALAKQNKVAVSMIGLGYHDTIMPEVIRRNVLENPGWYTAYTPYQAEVSQGRMEVLLNFQQMIMDLTGMEIANASLLDEATAAAEAMAMCRRSSKSKASYFFIADDCHPQTISVVQTRARSMGINTVVGNPAGDFDPADSFGLLLQYPGSDGSIHNYRELIATASKHNVLVCMACDLLSLAILTPPGELGADIAIGNSQRFGVPMGFGGPHAAFFATHDKLKRSMPGRIIGVSVDSNGQPALRMALQTREQHIRREKATSNICTAQVLLAVLAALYATYHGPTGIRRIAHRVHRYTGILASGLEAIGYQQKSIDFFDTVTIHCPNKATILANTAEAAGYNLRRVDNDHLGISLDETTNRQHIVDIWSIFAEGRRVAEFDSIDSQTDFGIPVELRRESDYLSHPVFNRYHNETVMMRYLRSRAAKDIALDQSMIPLGSCTMKLNAASQMLGVTLPGISKLHPFAPAEQTRGYQRLFADLERWLCECTGFDAVSLQPNAGSQGEYAGLLTIRRYHQDQGAGGRNICLIPASAHGTNPASATMAGLKVVVVKCDDDGNVDLQDLRAKSVQHTDHLAALMITYPSTHGVFEGAIKDICQVVHDHGGLVYFDGANLNAMLGIARPAELGADVCHMNLHKTFAIPHGGGGPGMGPIGVTHALAPYLPDHPVVPGVNPAASTTQGAISAAPWGSPGILPISWSYIRLLGAEGLLQSTKIAILSANYIARKLSVNYPVLYTGVNDMVAHECIIDFRPLIKRTGISIDDIAKRLIDYGFHAPTMSFPVPETLMIEPTESEPKAELDRFIEAMAAIRQEIAEIEDGTADSENNVLKNAPHSVKLLQSASWDRPYSREKAFFPSRAMREEKYWPPVGRVDNVHGDRNLICSCPPMEAYE